MNRMKLLRFWKLWKTETPLSRSVRPPFVSFGNRFVAYPNRNFLNKEQIVRIIRLRMARGNKYQKVIGISDLRRMELSKKEADRSSNSHTRDESDDGDGEDDESDDGDGEDDESDDGDGEDDDTSLSDSVVKLLKEKRDIGHLTLQVYRAYLRNHDLRISGNKAECLMRIHEHWRIKKSSGKALYPSSSFTIDCTGDVCKGDVVQFKQIVYGSSYNFTKIPRPAKVLGVRTVAGRVVNESYGAAKQQHTFTVEVLWTKGRKRLPPLFPLRVKGRNLYRIKTLRQPWKNEDERSKALSEKHTRGAIAKQDRSIQVQLQEMRDSGQSSDKVYQKQHSISNQPGKASANPVTRAFPSRCDGKIASTSGSYPNATYQQFRGMQMQSDCRSALFAFHRGNVPSELLLETVSWDAHSTLSIFESKM